MLKTKIKENCLNDKWIDLDKRISFLDLDIKRISEYILKSEQVKYTAVSGCYSKKIDSLMKLKYRLNMKKKSYIDRVRGLLDRYRKDHPLNLYNSSKFNDSERIEGLLKNLKIIKKGDTIGYFVLLNFYLAIKGTFLFNRLISINQDILKIEGFIKDYNGYFKEFRIENPFLYGNTKSRINQRDIDHLNRGIISGNIRAVMYYYYIKLKKVRNHNPIYKQNLQDKLSLNIVSEEEIKALIEENFKTNFTESINRLNHNIQIIENNILNKYF